MRVPHRQRIGEVHRKSLHIGARSTTKKNTLESEGNRITGGRRESTTQAGEISRKATTLLIACLPPKTGTFVCSFGRISSSFGPSGSTPNQSHPGCYSITNDRTSIAGPTQTQAGCNGGTSISQTRGNHTRILEKPTQHNATAVPASFSHRDSQDKRVRHTRELIVKGKKNTTVHSALECALGKHSPNRCRTPSSLASFTISFRRKDLRKPGGGERVGPTLASGNKPRNK